MLLTSQRTVVSLNSIIDRYTISVYVCNLTTVQSLAKALDCGYIRYVRIVEHVADHRSYVNIARSVGP